MIRFSPTYAATRAFGFELSARLFRVEHVADVNALSRQAFARRPDVRTDQVAPLCRSGHGGSHLRAELDREPGTRWGELDNPEAVVERKVGVQPPAEVGIELLRTVDVGHRNDDDLELEVDFVDDGRAGRVRAHFCSTHAVSPRDAVSSPWTTNWVAAIAFSRRNREGSFAGHYSQCNSGRAGSGDRGSVPPNQNWERSQKATM